MHEFELLSYEDIRELHGDQAERTIRDMMAFDSVDELLK